MIACLDACVLYPTVLREILLAVAKHGIYRPVWSPRIEMEWVRAAGKQGPGEAAIAKGEAAALRAEWPDALVDGGETSDLWLPDPGDIHVLATARAAGADTIVTLNLRDFPAREMSHLGIGAQHPDAFLYKMWLDAPDKVASAARAVHTQAEVISGREIDFRGLMKRARLPRLGKALA